MSVKKSALSTLAENNKPVELDVETQATVIGMAIKVSNQGVPYFTRSVAVQIKTALVADGVVTKDATLFEKLKTSQPEAWFRPVGDWLTLQEIEEEAETI